MVFKIIFKKFIFFKLIVFVAIIGFILSGCRKEKSVPGNQAIEGTIGLEVHAIHHNWDVSGITFYLEKNTSDFPGRDSSVYDLKGQGDGYGKYTFEKLYPGKYYLYASGYDVIWGSYVFGYAPVTLDNDNVVDNHAEVTLLVSE